MEAELKIHSVKILKDDYETLKKESVLLNIPVKKLLPALIACLDDERVRKLVIEKLFLG